MNKRFTLVFVLVLALSSLIMVRVELASASATVPKPSVPEFTVALVDASYDVPTTYSIDPYTGKQVAHGGYHVARSAIEVKIKNQLFTPFTDSDGHEIKFYYNIRIKGHYEEWGSVAVIYNYGQMPRQSNSEYTVISYNSSSTGRYSFDLTSVSRTLEVSPNGEVDFQVKALVGYTYEAVTVPPFHSTFFVGEESDWSETQTITVGGSASATTPTPLPSQSTSTPNESASPSQNLTATELSGTQLGVLFGLSWEQTALAVLCVLAVILVIADLVIHFKKLGGGQPK